MVETGALTWMDSIAMDRRMRPVEMGGPVSGLSLGNTDFQLPLKIFYWVQVRRLAWPLQDLEMLLTEPLLGCPGCGFWVVMLEDPAATRLQGCSWGDGGCWPRSCDAWPIHPPFNTLKLSCPICRKASPKNDVPTSKLHSRDGVLGVVLLLLPPNTASKV